MSSDSPAQYGIHVSVEGVPIQVLSTKNETHTLLQLKLFFFSQV